MRPAWEADSLPGMPFALLLLLGAGAMAMKKSPPAPPQPPTPDMVASPPPALPVTPDVQALANQASADAIAAQAAAASAPVIASHLALSIVKKPAPAPAQVAMQIVKTASDAVAHPAVASVV